MPVYRFKNVKSRHTENGKILKPGDIVELSYERYRGLRDRFEPVTVPVQVMPRKQVAPKIDFASGMSGNVESVKRFLGTLETIEQVQTAMELEEDSDQPRATVLRECQRLIRMMEQDLANEPANDEPDEDDSDPDDEI